MIEKIHHIGIAVHTLRACHSERQPILCAEDRPYAKESVRARSAVTACVPGPCRDNLRAHEDVAVHTLRACHSERQPITCAEDRPYAKESVRARGAAIARVPGPCRDHIRAHEGIVVHTLRACHSERQSNSRVEDRPYAKESVRARSAVLERVPGPCRDHIRAREDVAVHNSRACHSERQPISCAEDRPDAKESVRARGAAIARVPGLCRDNLRAREDIAVHSLRACHSERQPISCAEESPYVKESVRARGAAIARVPGPCRDHLRAHEDVGAHA